MVLKKNYLDILKADEIINLAEFVVSENMKHHSNDIRSDTYKKDVLSIYSEEMSFFDNSEVFVLKNYLEHILGSIRILKWNYVDQLPLQKIFGIDPLKCIGNTSFNNIWHIGRFAIKKEIRDITLFKKLMVCAISPVCRKRENIAFAECDRKLLRVLSLLGIKTSIIGKSINYLGSETIPISIAYDGLIGFYEENRRLVSQDLITPTVIGGYLAQKLSLSRTNPVTTL